jgi:hypothetical protein
MTARIANTNKGVPEPEEEVVSEVLEDDDAVGAAVGANVGGLNVVVVVVVVVVVTNPGQLVL